MFSFNGDTLKVKKVDVPSLGLNIMGDLQNSYRTYLEDTIKLDMEYLKDKLSENIGMQGLSIQTRVDSRKDHTFKRTQVKAGNHFYPVYVKFLINGKAVTPEWEVLRIPYMDDYGTVNIDGASKVVLSVQRAAEDISYNIKDNMFNIAMPYANVRIYGSSKHIKMAYGKGRLHMHDIIAAMLWEAGDKTPLCDIFTNTFLINAMKLDSGILHQYVYDRMKNTTDLLTKLKSNQYKLGQTRNALNENLTLHRAIGQTLSRDVLSYKAGTVITENMINDFVRNQINIIHVQNALLPTGYRLASETPIVITTIPKGMKNCSLLRERLPQFTGELYIPEEVELGLEDAIVISNNDDLTEREIEFLVAGGYTSLDVRAGKSQKVIKFSFEREIVGNYTARLKDLTTDIPAGRSADEWVYYYNNPNFNQSNPEFLTCHDFIAIVSIIGEIMLTGKATLLDRDTSFLKKILLINEVFSETLRKTIDVFVTKYQIPISKALTSGGDSNNPFWSLSKSWYSTMNDERMLSPADTINLSAEVSQANHVVTLVPNSSEVKDEQRHLAMPFYGRICPYETPAGKKLGLVNTKAVGTRIKDGLALTPYYKVIRTSNGIRISDKVTWMSVKDELGHKFGDILQFKKDANGNYMNTQVLARVPNPDGGSEPFIFKNIYTYDLADGYVSAVPEQYLSPTACLMPFACSDDPVRVSYGLSQLKQTVYEVHSQKPRVTTSMYEEMFTFADTEKYLMPCDGTITYIDNMRAEIRTITGENVTVKMQGSTHLGAMSATVEILAKPGDYLTEGTLIAQAHKYPQPYVVRAPYDGKIIDIGDNYITIYRGEESGFVDLDKADNIAITNGRIAGQSVVFLNIKVSVGDYVKKGQLLADTCASRGGVFSPSRNPLVAYDCFGYNYEDGVCATENASVEYMSIIAHHIDEVVSKRQYNFNRAKGLSGFKYCAPADKVGSIESRNNANDVKGHSRHVRATVKAHGIPFEYGVHDSDKKSVTYRFNILGLNKLQAGDKMSGRHGNKGVVSKVLKDSEAPQLLNGMTVRFVLNPCGVPSRMNLGQMYELHLSLCAEVLNITIESDAFNGASEEDVMYLMHYVHALANTESIGDNFTKSYNRAAFDAVCKAYSDLPKELHEHAWTQIERIIDWRGVFDRDGAAWLYDPETDSMFEGKMAIGFPYFNKLMQEADEKINSRAGLLQEQYALTTSQPQKGFKSAKGQRMAEMELMALAAMGTSAFIDEIINEKSDNTGRRVNNHLQQLGFAPKVSEYSCYSRAVENLIYLLEGCNVMMDVPPEVCKTDFRTSTLKHSIDVPKLVSENLSYSHNKTVTTTETVDDFDFKD